MYFSSAKQFVSLNVAACLSTCLSLQGYTTLQLVCSQEMHNLGYAWRTIKDQLGEDMEKDIHRMTFLKGKTVCRQANTHL